MQHDLSIARGTSLVQNVKISGIAIIGEDEISVNFRYLGKKVAPIVLIVAMSNQDLPRAAQVSLA